MKRNFAAWLTSMSIISVTKSKIWTSTIGRMPAIAAPTPAPQKVASEIGVSRTRSAPKRSSRPLLTWKMPPVSATSSPIRNTRGSRAISSAIASFSAAAKVSSRVPGSAGSTCATCGA